MTDPPITEPMQTKPPRTKPPHTEPQHQYTKTTSYTKTYSYSPSGSTKAYSYSPTMKPHSYSLTTPTMKPPQRNSNNKETIKRLINSRQRNPLQQNTRWFDASKSLSTLKIQKPIKNIFRGKVLQQ